MATTKVNVHQTERIASAALGGILMLRSLITHPFALVDKAIAAALLYRGISGHSYLYQALGVNTANGKNTSDATGDNANPEVERSITVGKPANELYQFWRDPQRLSQIMGNSIQVTSTGENRTHWVLHGPLNQHIEYDTQIVEDRPGELLRWRTLEGAQLPNEDWVSFHPAPGNRGTEVTFHINYNPPGGTLGNEIAKSLKIVPGMIEEQVLRRFKSIAESGEAPTLAHNPSGRASQAQS